jgi:photosystem II stability/assembly factor-like uncharacterized protein
MKHLKKSHLLLLLVFTVILASWTLAGGFSGLHWFDQKQQTGATCAVSQDSVSVKTGTVGCLKSTAVNPTPTTPVKPGTDNIIFQSTDGGQTWQDISAGLPEQEGLEDFFAGESELYVRIKNVMYSSKSNLKTPVWEKEDGLDLKNTSIAFTRSGVMAFTPEGQIFQKSSAGTWQPIYTNFKKNLMHTIFETSDGNLFIGSVDGHFKSSDQGATWKQVHDGILGMVESDGILIATYSKGRQQHKGEPGIMRSADAGETWESVISERGVGIAVERIDGGFAAISYSYLTESRRIRISMDAGKTWTAIDENLPPSLSISSIKQAGNALLCGHPDGIFCSTDMGKTWKLVLPGVDPAFAVGNAGTATSSLFSTFMPTAKTNNPPQDKRRVFKLYGSGKVLYAVARHFGC